MIYAFSERRQTHSTPIKRHSGPSLQAVDHHRNLAGTEIRQHPIYVAGIRPSGQKGRIPAGWPDRSGQIRPDPCRLAGFRRFWQIPASIPESGQPKFRRNCSDSSLYLGFQL
jgi:hypothetical protein